MKRKITYGLLFIIVLQLYLLSPVYAAIETSDYGWVLGKYNTSTKTFSPSNTTELGWNGLRVRTIGPWSIYNGADGTRQGSIISFVDKNKPEDNGYPMVCQNDWDKWISYFNGNPTYVKSVLQKWDLITGDGITKKTFANFSQLVELCGGKGVSYNISSASSTYARSYNPVANLTASSYAVTVGQAFKLYVNTKSYTYYYQYIDVKLTGAGNTYINQRFNSTNVNVEKNLVFSAPGQYRFTLQINDGVYRYAQKEVVINVSDPEDPIIIPEQPPSDPPPPPPASDPNEPPVARFSWPTTAYEDDMVNVTENSVDYDGQVVDWSWSPSPSTGVSKDLKQGGGTISFAAAGSYTLSLRVEDDDGASDRTSKGITILKPIPTAVITYSGTLKENRKVTLDSSDSDSAGKYPIDHSKDQWTIDPVTGGSYSDIKYGVKNGSIQEVLFKKAGTYKVGLRVSNSKYQSEWVYKDIVIVPDDPPVANFILPTIVFREPLDLNYASIKLTDKSYSTDDDIISQRIWKYKFDSNNNGDFSDDIWVVLDSVNNAGPFLRVNHVGKYLFELEIKEGFGQPTIPELISDTDYRRGDTFSKVYSEKVVEVKNIAPTTAFSASIKPKVDIVFSQGFLQDYTNRFPNMINNLEGIVGTKLRAKGIDAAFYNTDNLASETIYRWSSYLNGDHIDADYDEVGQFADYRTFDLGKSINKNTITSMSLNYTAYEKAKQTAIYRLYVSQDNISWSQVKQWSYYNSSAHWRISETVDILPSLIPLSNFRYIKLKASNVWGLDEYYQWITLNNTPHANLADLQTKAGENKRTGASKFIVSLAEESYVDGTAANYTNTANALNQNNAYLAAFANTTSQASVQQLTSKVTNQKLIITSTDLNPALDQLADYIISQTTSSQMINVVPILLDQSLTYTPTYSDYENDPKFTDNWYYVHDPNFVDNNNGLSTYNGKTYTTPITSFDKYGKYDVYYKAQDDPASADNRFSNYRLWSEPAPTSIIVHRKPIASFTVQPGTLYITDTSYDPDFQFKRPDKGLIEWYWQWKKTTETNWTAGKPTGITQPGDYYFYLKVKDVYGVWSDPYQMAITVTEMNRPPVAEFSWTPTLIYEADDITLRNLSYDPDNDPITYQWAVFDPNGITKTYTTKDVFLSSALTGTYWVTLRVWDNKSATDVTTKSLSVNPLGITGHVKHTDAWNTNRITYNRSVSGRDDYPRPYNMFWAGEKFILTADTTDTGLSTTKAQSVSVSLPSAGAAVSLTGNAAKTSWTGEMWQDNFVNLGDGPYKFIFTATYSNGAVKTNEVWIDISGSVYDYHRFHRAE